MIKVNLLPVRAAAKLESLKVQASIAVLSLILLSIIIGYFHYMISDRIDGIRIEINDTQKEIDSLKSIIAKVNKFKKDKEVLEKKLNVIKKLDQGRRGPVHLMDELSSVVPDKLWIENLKEAGWRLTMTGLALDHDTIADFMTNMERSAMFENVKLQSTQQQKRAGLNLLKFAINANFLPPKPKED